MTLSRLGSSLSTAMSYLRPRLLLQLMATALLQMRYLTSVIVHRRLGRRERVLLWLNKTLKEGHVCDLQSVWRDGTILCTLIETLAPDSNLQYGSTLRHGQKMAYQVLGVPPAFTEDELQQVTFSLHLERRLLRYLSAIQLAISRHPVINHGPSSNPDAGIPIITNCIARGMGLLTASQYHRANLYVYLLDLNLSNADVFIVMQSEHDFGFARIGIKRSSKIPRKFANIPVNYSINRNCIRVHYTPQHCGLHELSILRKGAHIPGSPFSIPVEKSEMNQTSDKYIEDAKKKMPRKKLRVLLRIVDFVTEKMLLTDDGKFKCISTENNLLNGPKSVSLFEEQLSKGKQVLTEVSTPISIPRLFVENIHGKAEEETRNVETWESYSESSGSTPDINSDTSSDRSSKLGRDMSQDIESLQSTRDDGDKNYNGELSGGATSLPTESVSLELESPLLTSKLCKNYSDATSGEMHCKGGKSKYLHRQGNLTSSALSPLARETSVENTKLRCKDNVSEITVRNKDLKTNCKKVVAACRFLMGNIQRQKSLELLNRAAHILDGRPIRVSKDIYELLEKIRSSTTLSDDIGQTSNSNSFMITKQEQSVSEIHQNTATTSSADAVINYCAVGKLLPVTVVDNDFAGGSFIKLADEKNTELAVVSSTHIVNTEPSPLRSCRVADVTENIVEGHEIEIITANHTSTYSEEFSVNHKNAHDESVKSCEEVNLPVTGVYDVLFGGETEPNIDNDFMRWEDETLENSRDPTIPMCSNNIETIDMCDIRTSGKFDRRESKHVREAPVDNGPPSSSTPSTTSLINAVFTDMEGYLSENFGASMMPETQFHQWPSDIAFSGKEQTIDFEDDGVVDFDSVISAPNIEEALIKLEQGLRKKNEMKTEMNRMHKVVMPEDNGMRIDDYVAGTSGCSTAIIPGCDVARVQESNYLDDNIHQRTDFHECSESTQSTVEGITNNSLGMPDYKPETCDGSEAEDDSSLENQHGSLNNPDIDDVSCSPSTAEDASPFADGENLNSDFCDSAYLSIDDLQNSSKTSPVNDLNEAKISNLEGDGEGEEQLEDVWKEDRDSAITGFMGPAEKEIWGIQEEDEDWPNILRYYPSILTPLPPQMSSIVEEEEEQTNKHSDERHCDGEHKEAFVSSYRIAPEIMVTLSSLEQPGTSNNHELQDTTISFLEAEDTSLLNQTLQNDFHDDDDSIMTLGFQPECKINADEEENGGIVHVDDVNMQMQQEMQVLNKIDVFQVITQVKTEIKSDSSVLRNEKWDASSDNEEGTTNSDNSSDAAKSILKEERSFVKFEFDAQITSPISYKEDDISRHENDRAFILTPTCITDKKCDLTETRSDDCYESPEHLQDGFSVQMKVHLRKQYWDRKFRTLENECLDSNTKQSSTKIKHFAETYPKFLRKLPNDVNDLTKTNNQDSENISGIVKKWRQNYEAELSKSRSAVERKLIDAPLVEVKTIRESRVVTEKRRFWTNLKEEKSQSTKVQTSDREVETKSPSLYHARLVAVSENTEDDIYETNPSIAFSTEEKWKTDIQKQITSRDLVKQRRSQQIISVVSSPRHNKINKDEIRSRFETAKHFFQSLEKNKSNDFQLSEPQNIPVLKRRSKKRRLLKIHSAPSSDSETAVRTPETKCSSPIIGGSERMKVSERFHVKDLFKDVIGASGSDGGGFMKGIPHREAVLKSLLSVMPTRAPSPYEDAAHCCPHNDNHDGVIATSAVQYQTEYPHLTMTAPRGFRSRSNLQTNTGLIPRNQLLLEEEIYHV